MRLFKDDCTGRSRTLEVNPTDLILEAKFQLFEKDGTPVCQQRLFWNRYELQNDKTFEYYNIQEDFKILSVISFRKVPEGQLKLFVQRSDETLMEMEVNAEMTVKELKHKVVAMIGSNKPENPENLGVFFHGHKLREDCDYKHTLINYGITDQSILTYTLQC